MYSKIKRLRVRGARLGDREIQADYGTVGHLTMSMVGGARELKLHALGDDAQANAVIPVLMDATLVSMHGARMLFTGYERQGADPKGVTYMQEWAVEVMVEQPAKLARSAPRLS